MDNKILDLISEIENAKQVGKDVEDETQKMFEQVRKVKEDKLKAIQNITDDFHRLMFENHISKLESNKHGWHCGQMYYPFATFEIVGTHSNIHACTNGGHEPQVIRTLSYEGSTSQDFLLQYWDIVYDELIMDFKNKFQDSLANIHDEYEATLKEFNELCKGE